MTKVPRSAAMRLFLLLPIAAGMWLLLQAAPAEAQCVPGGDTWGECCSGDYCDSAGYCGDGHCSRYGMGEDESSCAADCGCDPSVSGLCASDGICGDSHCSTYGLGEDASNCAFDCDRRTLTVQVAAGAGPVYITYENYKRQGQCGDGQTCTFEIAVSDFADLSSGASGVIWQGCNGTSYGNCYVSTMTDARTVSVAATCGNGTLDAGEQCDGESCCDPSYCRFRSSSTVCRASADVCDSEERCTGSSASCPADAPKAAGTLCRYGGAECDATEVCDGISMSCGADAAEPEGTDCTIGGTATFTFTNTSGDDINDEALKAFFEAHPASATDYIFFEVAGTSSGGAWCSERADWYRSEYLVRATGTGGSSLVSGAWQKWSRPNGGAWSAPTTQGRRNYWGTHCDSKQYAWCSEWGLGGKYLRVSPAATADSETNPHAYGASAYQMTIRIGDSFETACNGAAPANAAPGVCLDDGIVTSCEPRPENDQPSGAIDLPGSGYTSVSGDTTWATDVTSASCGGSGAGDLFYRIDVPEMSRIYTYVNDSSGTNWYPTIYLLDAATMGEAHCPSYTSSNYAEMWPVIEPGTYYLVVDSSSGGSGAFDLYVDLWPVTPVTVWVDIGEGIDFVQMYWEFGYQYDECWDPGGCAIETYSDDYLDLYAEPPAGAVWTGCDYSSGNYCAVYPSSSIGVSVAATCGNGTVDSGEECDGGDCCDANTCQFKSSSTVCRGSTTSCDAEEKCTGSDASCPADQAKPAGTVCRNGVDGCDAAEVCDGASMACPADGAMVDGTMCTIGEISTFTFTNTSGDDIYGEALAEFFQAHPASASDYIFFEVKGASSSSGAWCAQRADWYQSEYLTRATAANGSNATSGAWQKWTRSNGGAWSAPTTQARTNYFSKNCNSKQYSWCSEWGLGSKYLRVAPAATDGQETNPAASATYAYQLTIRIGDSFETACNGTPPASAQGGICLSDGVSSSCQPRPVNDTPSGAIQLSDYGTTELSADATWATDVTSASCGGSGAGDLFYRLDIYGTSRLYANVSDPTYNSWYPSIYVLDAATMDEVRCENYSYYNADLWPILEPGSYYLVIDGDSGPTGAFDLFVDVYPVTMQTVTVDVGSSTSSVEMYWNYGYEYSSCAGPGSCSIELSPDDYLDLYAQPTAGNGWFGCEYTSGNYCSVSGSFAPATLSVGALCGNGIVEPGEPCDDAGPSATCNADCTPAVCGDGIVNAAAGEACDDAGQSASCDADCTLATCGDGVTNAAAGEACDDAGASATCDADCTTAICGDGVANAAAGEACDDAGASATCDADCTPALCGDGVANAAAGEACDDGGESAGCNANCTVTTCGDGIINAAAGETCETADGPCCDPASCTLAPSTTVCRAAGSACDAAETCTGSSASCPADAIAPAGTSCRPEAGSCDVAEVCDGVSTSCPTDTFVAAGTVCQPPAPALPSMCDGASAACNECPPGGCTVCGNATCEAGEACYNCPQDCGSCAGCGDGACGVGESCQNCAADCGICGSCVGAPSGQPCDDGSPLTHSDMCDGSGSCVGVLKQCPADTACRSYVMIADGTPFCTTSFAPAGTPCDDGLSCTTADICDGEGACVAN